MFAFDHDRLGKGEDHRSRGTFTDANRCEARARDGHVDRHVSPASVLRPSKHSYFPDSTVAGDSDSRKGWRRLEVGAGGGSIASWFAHRMGSEGHVLATDLLEDHTAIQ
jgi:2-polyprenyl-3-methyl-5-hydroxy-6-metoxy-1,4-benzoquinol methylase